MVHQLHDGGGGGGIYVPTSNGKTPINPNLIPGADIDPDTIETNAASIATGATAIRDNGASVLSTWQGLSAHYTAPEQHLVLGLVDPVGTETTTVGDDLDTIADALNGYAEDIRPIKTELDRLRQEAIEFIQGPVYNGVEVRRLNPEWTATQSYYGGYGTSYSYTSTSYTTQQTTSSSTPTPPKYVTETVEWHEDQETVDQNNALINAVNAQQVLMWEVERTWANRIRALWGGAELHAYQSENDVNGYGLDEIPEGTEMPWGTPTERTEGCAEATINNVFVDFLWEGVIVGGIWGTITGLGTLVLGYNPATGEFFSGDAYGMAWSNLGMLAAGLVMNATPVGPLITAGGVVEDLTGIDIVPDAVQDFYNGANETLLETGKSLIAWDKWADDPWTAAGETTFNLGTILIPGGAAVAGIKGAGAAASVLARMARVVDFIDPGAWAFNGAVRIGGLGADGIRTLLGDLSRLENPDLPVRFTSDDPTSAINQLVDDLGVDPQSMSWSQTADGAPVLEFPGGAVEFPAGTFDDVVPASTADDLVPAGTRTEVGDGVNSSVSEPPVSQAPPGAPAAAAATPQGSTLVADPVPTGPLDGPTTGNGTGSSSSSSGETGSGSGSGSGGDGGGPTSGGSDVATGGSPEQPMSGPEHRGDPVDASYGEPRAESGTLADAYAPPVREGADGLPELDTSQLAPEVRDLVQDPAAPFGRDPQTQQPFTKAEWESRYMGPDNRPIYPGNDGAVAGSRVEYSDPAAYFAEHGPTVDRLGGDGGSFFGRVGDGFESRALPGSNLSAPYTVYRFADEWPPNMRVEVSEIAPAFGQPGGGTQFRVMMEVDGNWVDVPASQLVDDGILRVDGPPAGGVVDGPASKPDGPGSVVDGGSVGSRDVPDSTMRVGDEALPFSAADGAHMSDVPDPRVDVDPETGGYRLVDQPKIYGDVSYGHVPEPTPAHVLEMPEVQALLNGEPPVLRYENGVLTRADGPYVVTMNRSNPAHSLAEMIRQARLQEMGANRGTIGETLYNIDRYLGNIDGVDGGRIGKTEQGNYADSVSAADKGVFNSPHVLHGQDQYPGGNAFNFDGVGEGNVNSSLGTQWQREAGYLREDLAAFADGLPPGIAQWVHPNVEIRVIDRLSVAP